MRYLIIFLVFSFLISSICISQTHDTIIKVCQTERMIQDALLKVLEIEKGYIERGSTNAKIDDDFNIWIDHFPYGFEPTQEIVDCGLRLKYISKHSLTEEQKKLGIDGIAFSGVIIDGNKIRLNFFSMNLYLKEDMLMIGISGDSFLFEYEYSCEKQEWVLIKMPKQYKLK